MAKATERIGPAARRRSRGRLSLITAMLAFGLAPAAAPAAAGDTSTTASSASSNTAVTATETQTVTATQTATATATTTQTATATTTATHTTTTHVALANAPTRLESPTSLSGWLSPTARFPRRTLVLSGPAGRLPRAQLSLTENGVAVTDATATPLTTPAKGEVGVMLVVDDNASMTPDLQGVLSAAGMLAAQRPSAEQLGLITFDATPYTVLAPTTDSDRISHAFGPIPAPGAGADLGAATQTAVQALAGTHVALGVAIVISDGVDLDATGATAARAAAAAAHVPVVTIGLRDSRATALSLAALRRAAAGPFVTATPTALLSVLQSSLAQQLSGHELVSWRSSAPAGRAVTVNAAAQGLVGTVGATYTTPAPPHRPAKPSHRPVRGHRAPHHAAAHPAPAASTTAATTPAPNPVPATAPVSPFWHGSAGVLSIALLVALLVGVMVMFVLRRPDQRAVRNRVGSYVPVDGEGVEGLAVAEETRRKGLAGALQRGTWWPAFVEAVEVSRNPKSPGFLMKRAAIVAVLLSPLFALITHVTFLFMMPLVAFPFVQRWWVMRAARKQREKFADSLPSYMQDMASAIRVGRSFAGALAVVADSADEPTRSEFERAVTDESLGRPLEESLEAVGVRMQSTEMDQIALIAELNRRSGSNVAESLDRVAEGARDRADLRREMRALTAQSKMSSSVLTGLPIVLTLGISVLAPRYAHPLFHTTLGWVSMFVAALLVFSGWKVLKKISDVGV